MPTKQLVEYSPGRNLCERLYTKGSTFPPIKGIVRLLLHILTDIEGHSSEDDDCYLRRWNSPRGILKAKQDPATQENSEIVCPHLFNHADTFDRITSGLNIK